MYLESLKAGEVLGDHAEYIVKMMSELGHGCLLTLVQGEEQFPSPLPATNLTALAAAAQFRVEATKGLGPPRQRRRFIAVRLLLAHRGDGAAEVGGAGIEGGGQSARLLQFA